MTLSTKIDGIISESQELVDIYLAAKEKSAPTIISALRRLVEETNKTDITNINYRDYLIYVKPFESDTTPAKLKREFIKFLYAFDFLKDNSEFEKEYWNPIEIKENFEKESKKRDKKKYKAALQFEQIEKIQQFISHIDENDFDLIKLDLAFYMCFFTDVENVNDLRDADAMNYKNKIWTINDRDYEIPRKYTQYLQHLQTIQYSKFTRIHNYIKQLGKQVGINSLYPKDVIKARKQMQVSCFECGEQYLIFKENWVSINAKIMCKICADKILNQENVKKNFITDDLQCYEIDILSSKEKINTEIATNSFDSLREQIPIKFNFAKLQEFLIYIGRLGEKYVYEYEKSVLANTKYYDMIDITPSMDNTNGYDILSFDRNGTPVMIEVKTTTGNEEESFFVTNRELETAKKAWAEGKKYKFYRVGNILAQDKSIISLKIYEKLSEENFEISGVVYKVKEISP